MKTKEMISLLVETGYSMRLLAAQSRISYMKLFRYMQRDGSLSPDEKSKLWRFGITQQVVSDALAIDIHEEKK